MTEHASPGDPDAGGEKTARPVLSRYARRASTSVPGPERSSETSDADGTKARDEDFELSERTADLPTATPAGSNAHVATSADSDPAPATPRSVERDPFPVDSDARDATAAGTAAGPGRDGASDPATDRGESDAVDVMADRADVESDAADGSTFAWPTEAPTAAPIVPHAHASPLPSSARTASATRPASGVETNRPPLESPAADRVRRVEASEVRDAASAGGWMSALVTLPGDSEAERSGRKKVPFWKRIALARTQSAPSAGGTAAPRPLSLEPVLTRLNALEKQLAANQSATESQLARFEENITRLWELEEQLTVTEVRERLALLEANQQEIADALHTVGRNLTLLAVVLAAGLMAGLLALGLLL